MAHWMTCLAVAVTLVAPHGVGASDLREQSARDWDARGLTRIEIENSRGLTSVRPSRDGRVHLVALKLVRRAQGQGGERMARDTRVESELLAGTLRVHARYSQNGQIHINLWQLMKGIEIPEVEVRLALEVPPALLVTVRSASGDVETSGLSGGQELIAASGDVQVQDARGALRVETRSGDVTLDDVGRGQVSTSSGDVTVALAGGGLTVTTGSGDVRVDSAADSLAIETSSGEVRVGLARLGFDISTGSGDVIARAGGTIHLRTESGDAKVALIAPLRRGDLSSGSGDLSVRVAAGIEGRIDVDAGSGEVDIQLPMTERTSHENHVVGRLGRGNAELIIRSSSGSVNVTR